MCTIWVRIALCKTWVIEDPVFLSSMVKTLRLIKKPLYDKYYQSILVTFLRLTEHFSGKNGALRWSIFFLDWDEDELME